MKGKFLEIILTVFILVIFSSCNSCTSSSAQVAQNSQDTVYSKSVVKGDTINLVLMSEQDTVKKRIIFKKDIKPIEIDTTQGKVFRELQETQIIIQEQQKQIDSMIVIKKK